MTDVHYGLHIQQTMDIYLPAKRSTSSTKTMIVIHGGGFNGGSKEDLNLYLDALRPRLLDYAFFNINYRLAVDNLTLFPAQENDVKAVVDHIVGNAKNYSVSKNIALLGISSGGLLALLQGYKYSSPVRAKAVISFFAPVDLRELYYHPVNPLVPVVLLQVIGKTPEEDALIYADSSPVNFVSRTSPPTLMLQGGKDPLVDPGHTSLLIKKLTGNGVINQYVLYPAEGHGWTGDNLEDSLSKIEMFLAINML
jgi:acetyl esterase/lipase